jgi:YD repeat-containing protein
VEPSEKVIRLHDEEGLPVDFAAPAPGGVSFHRGRRLELRAVGKRYQIRSASDRLVREFSALPDGRFALVSITDPYLHRIELEHRGSSLVRISDGCGRDVRVLSDEKGRVVRVEVWARAPGTEDEAPTLQTWFDYDYHVEGTLASHTNALSHVERWEYDGLHRMVKTTARNGLSFHYEHDEETGRCVRTWGDGGLHDIHLVIDEEKGEARTHGTSRARRYLVKDGVVQREETFDGGWASVRELDGDGLLICRGNAAGEAFTYEHDARGNLIKQTSPPGSTRATRRSGGSTRPASRRATSTTRTGRW